MSQPVRGKLLTALGAVWVLCLGGLGCSAQVSYSLLNGPAPDAPAATARRAEPVVQHPVEVAGYSEVVPASWQTVDRSGKPPLTPVARVSVTPAPEPSGPPPLAAFPEVPPPETVPAPVVPDLLPATSAAAPDLKPAGSPARPTTVYLRPGSEASPVPHGRGDEINLADLPEFQPPDAKIPPATLPVSVEDPRPNDPLLNPAAAPPDHQPLALPSAAVPGPCCQTPDHGAGPAGPVDPGDRPLPTELAMVSHPPYMIEPPDILLLDSIRMIPRPPYTVQPLDVLLVRVSGTAANQPIDGAFVVAPDGTVSLGYSYGVVRVAGMSLEAVQSAITRHLGRILTNPQVSVGLGQFRGMQQLRGEHLVRQDGTISLGTYGCVYVTGMTIPQAKHAIEQHLSQFLLDPEVSLDVFAYNSKVYYIIADGAGFGQQVFRFPITGKETVLDAISQIQGLPVVASKKHIWLARPTPADHACVQVLPVDWLAISQGGSTATNYQLFPGDRIYIKSDCLIRLDNAIAKLVAPIERVLGVTLLGASTVQTIRNTNNRNGNGAIAFVP